MSIEFWSYMIAQNSIRKIVKFADDFQKIFKDKVEYVVWTTSSGEPESVLVIY